MIDQAAIATWRGLESEVRRVVTQRLSAKAAADADDIVQEVLIRIGRAGDSGDALGAGYVYRAATHAVIDHQRSCARANRTYVELDSAVLPPSLEEPEREILESLIDCLPAFLSQLSDVDREVLRVVYLEDHAQVEAARVLGLSVSGMKSRVQRSRARLRALYDACCAIALDARSSPFECVPRWNWGSALLEESSAAESAGCCCDTREER